MFAFALWDRQARTLTLGRDRLGEKPVYYGWQGRGAQRVFLFGSELKALRIHPAFSADVDRDSLCLLMRHNCVPAPYSIYTDVFKLPAGCLLDVSLSNPEATATPYWSAITTAERGLAARGKLGEAEQLAELEELFPETTADAPAGARAICACLGINEAAIRGAIAAGATLAALQDQLKCGTQCGSCVPELRRLLAA